jgi:hypothetical protein
MTSILSGLDGIAADPAAPPSDNPSERPLLVLRAIASGQIPGVTVPSDAPSIPSDLTPDDIAGAGVGLYKPQSEGFAVVLFNESKVALPDLQRMDAAGTLAEALPSITSFLAPPAPGDDAGPVAAAEDAAKVPVMPRPGMSGDAQRQVADARMDNLTPVEPSKRAIPGGGTILNGLLKRAV